MVWDWNRGIRGSMTLEASLVIPVAVMCILPFIYLFRMMLFQIIVEKNLDECMKEMATEVYILERISVMPEYEETEETQTTVEESQVDQIVALIEEYTALLEKEEWKRKLEEMGFELLGELLLEQKIRERMENVNLEYWGVINGWKGFSFSESDFFYTEEGHHCLLKGVVIFGWNTAFSFWQPDKVKIERVYHSFVGEPGKTGGENTEEYINAEVVYLIGDGTRYHKSSCYLICKSTYSTTKSNAEQMGNTPCERCKPQNETTVYKTGGGEHYHIYGCSYLYPDTTEITMAEAIRLGYSGCRICQGENTYFS